MYFFQAQYEFYDKFTLGILNNDMNTVLKGNGHSENVSMIDKVEKEDIKQEDLENQVIKVFEAAKVKVHGRTL